MANGLMVDPHGLPLEALCQRAWTLAAPQQQARQTAWRESYAAALAKGEGSEDLSQVAHAAVAGRVATLLINTDVHIEGTEALAAEVSSAVEHALAHVQAQVTRVEVHLSDENGGKTGQHDQRCMTEARLQDRQPLAVTDHASTLEQAVQGAARKLVRLLDRSLGRLNNHHPHAGGMPADRIEPTKP